MNRYEEEIEHLKGQISDGQKAEATLQDRYKIHTYFN